jgi:hypothetical protein
MIFLRKSNLGKRKEIVFEKKKETSNQLLVSREEKEDNFIHSKFLRPGIQISFIISREKKCIYLQDVKIEPKKLIKKKNSMQ